MLDRSFIPVGVQVQTQGPAEPQADPRGLEGLVWWIIRHLFVFWVEPVDDLRVGVQTAKLPIEAVGDETWEMHHHVAVHLRRQPGEAAGRDDRKSGPFII